MCPSLKTFGVALCVLTATSLVEAQSPSLSVSFASEDILQFSWPGNFTTWQLVSTTNVTLGIWQPVPLAPFQSSNVLTVFWPITDVKRYFRLQQIGPGSCVFHGTPPLINSGGSSTLTWCPLAGYSYRITPGPGNVPGGSLVVSPASTTVYSLIASNNALGVLMTNDFAVIVDPCGWLHVTNMVLHLDLIYVFSTSTASYNFKILHSVFTTFHLQRLESSTDTDAYFFGFTSEDPDPDSGSVIDSAHIQDREDDKTGPGVFTTTELGRGRTDHTGSTLMLHLTCNTYDFSYNVFLNTTEISPFGTDSSIDGVAAGAIATRPFILTEYNDILASGSIPAEYPPSTADFFSPSSSLGKAMFNTGTASAPNAGKTIVTWLFHPAP